MTHRNTLGFATRCVHAGQENDPTTGAVMTPIYATSTFAQSSPGVHKGFEYARSQNPTRMAFERCIADLEGGSAGFAFASGMAATATVLDCLEKNSHVVVGDDVYGGTRRLFNLVRSAIGRDRGEPSSIFRSRSALMARFALTAPVWLETPTNPMLKVIDLERVAAIARAKKVLGRAITLLRVPWTQRRGTWLRFGHASPPPSISTDIPIWSAVSWSWGRRRTARAHGVPENAVGATRDHSIPFWRYAE